MLASSADGGYRLELGWRSLPGLLGRGVETPSEGARARPPLPGSKDTRSIHLVYGFTSEGLTRWTAHSGSVRCEVLRASREECDLIVDRAMQLMSIDPGSPDALMPDTVRTVCSELGRLLLPPDVRGPPGVPIFVSAEGSIARLSFEALGVGGADYEPLIARHDVAYARPVPPRRRGSGDGTSVILVGGENEGTIGPTLAAVGTEAVRASARLPRARILRSSEISKQALLDTMSRASILYVAAHLVRDPEAPLLCYFPMSFGARPYRPEDTYLDLRDVRITDLSGCRLAVLSTCASGEPYVVGGRAGPSMADALLDAGAQAVIHTRWRVRDDRAAIIAPQLAEAWIGARDDRVSAWCARRRPMLQGPNGWRHPFDWAAWSVTVELPTEPWRAARGDLMAAQARPTPLPHGAPVASPGPSGSPR